MSQALLAIYEEIHRSSVYPLHNARKAEFKCFSVLNL